MATYEAGRVLLQVAPSFDGVQKRIDREAAKWGLSAGAIFSAAFKAEVERSAAPRLGPTDADAAKQGEDAGKAYHGGFRAGLGAGGPIPVPGPGSAASRKQGAESGDAFGNAFRRQLEAATRALPRIELPMATTEAKQKIRDLRSDLERLSGQRVGIDIDEATATAEIERLKTELRALGASSPDITVRTNTAAAISQLEAFQAEIRRINGEDVKVDIEVRDGAFAAQVRDAIRRAQAALPRIEIDANTTPADIEIQRIRARLETLGEKRIGVDINAADAAAQITRLQERLARLTAGNHDVRVTTDAAAASAALARVQAQVDRLNGSNARVDIDSNSINTFSGRLVLLGTLIGSLLPALVPIGGAALVGIGGIGAAASASIPAVGALVLGLHGVGDALKQMGAVDEESAQTAQKNAQARQQQAQAQANAARQVESAEASLANTRATAARAAQQAARQVADAQVAVAEAERAASKSAEDSASRVADAQQKLVDAREEAARTAEQSARRIADAEQTVADAQDRAVKAAEDAADRVAKAREQQTRATETAARGVRSALRQQEDAEKSLAKAQEAALAAQQALTQAKKDAQAASEDLAFRVQKGALDQRQAVLDVADAQKELDDTLADPGASDDAREQARIRFEEAQLQLKQLGVDNARLAQQQADAQAKGIDGSDQVVAAQQRLQDAVERRADAERAANEAAQAVQDARLEGARQMADAVAAVADAQQAATESAQSSARSIADAERGLSDAREAAALTAEQSTRRVADAEKAAADAAAASEQSRLDGLAKIADAQQGVADAVAAQSEQQRSAAFSLEQAERSLQGAREAAAAAAAGTAVAATAAMQNLQVAMDKLSPTQQRFAEFLYGLRGEVGKLQDASAAGMLPGFQAGIEALLPLMPVFQDILRNVGGALGDLAKRAGEALASPEWAPFFAFLRDQGGSLLTQFGKIIGNLATTLLPGLVAAFGPISSQVLGVLERLTGRFADFLLTAQDSDAFQAFMAYVQENAPKVGEFFGALSDAFVNIIESMAPFGPVILGVITGLLNLIAAVPPGVLQTVALAVLGIVSAFTILGPVIAFVSGIVAAVSAGVPILGAVIAALGGPVTLIIAGLVALGAVLVTAYQRSETFRDIVNGAFGAVRDFIVGVVWERGLKPTFQAIVDFWQNVLAPAATWLWKNVLQPAFEGIAAAVKWAWENVIKPTLDALEKFFRNVIAPVVTWLWREVFAPVFSAIGKVIEVWWAAARIIFDVLVYTFREVIAPALTWLWQNVFRPAFEGIGNAVKWAWENVISPALNALKGFFDSTLGPAISRGVDAFTTAWDRMKRAAADPINFVIREIYTGGIKKLFDQVAVAVKSDVRLPVINEVGFARGGWTGPGSRFQEAGIVHADEFVINKPSRQRFESRFPGVLDYINATGALPGYAGGGRVSDLLAFARRIQAMGYDVGENKALGDNPRPGAHSAGGYHYKFDNSGAVDVNHGAGTSKAEQAALAKIVPLAAEYGLRTIFMVKDHFDHAHFDVGGSGSKGILDKLGDFVGGAWDTVKGTLGEAWSAAQDVASPFTDLIRKIASGVGDSPMGKLTGSAATQTFSMAVDWVKNAASTLFGMGGEDNATYTGGKGVEQWRSVAQQALAITGSPASWIGSLLRRMNQESGGNPRAINLTDSNAKKGIPSKGLMQVIDPTFRANALAPYNRDVYDPLSNIIASIRYANGRYGSAPKGWDRKGGYWAGGLVGAKPYLFDQGGVVPPGYSTLVNATRQPEALLNPQQWSDIRSVALDRGRGTDRQLVVNAYGAREDVLAANVLERMRQQEALAWP